MKPLVLTSRACFLAVRRHKLLLTDYISRNQIEFFSRHLPFDSVIIYRAGGSVSFEAVRFLMQNGVPMVHFSWDGSITGVTLPPGPISGQLRIAQYRSFLDMSTRNKLGRAFVDEKVSKSINLLLFLKRRYPQIDLSGIQMVAGSASPTGDEGKIAGMYWTEIAHVLDVVQPQLQFSGRHKTPNNMSATDPVNSLLNYGYGILEAKVRFAIQKAGLDPEIGFLHLPKAGAFPLVYDVMELFRWLVDLTIVELLETKSIRQEDFQTDSEYRVILREEAAHRVVRRLSENFNRTVNIKGRNLRLDSILDLDIRKIVRYIGGQSPAPEFSCPLAVDDSKVDSELLDRFLKLTPAERKKAGVLKTTLFYIRRNAASGRPFRINRRTRERIGVDSVTAIQDNL